jgi:hypothetical protein
VSGELAGARKNNAGRNALIRQRLKGLWRRFVIGPLKASPVVNGHPDGVWSKITAKHFVFGDAAQRVGYTLLGYLVSFLDAFPQNHFCRRRRAGDGHRAARAFESHVLNDIILDAECY